MMSDEKSLDLAEGSHQKIQPNKRPAPSGYHLDFSKNANAPFKLTPDGKKPETA